MSQAIYRIYWGTSTDGHASRDQVFWYHPGLNVYAVRRKLTQTQQMIRANLAGPSSLRPLLVISSHPTSSQSQVCFLSNIQALVAMILTSVWSSFPQHPDLKPDPGCLSIIHSRTRAEGAIMVRVSLLTPRNSDVVATAAFSPGCLDSGHSSARNSNAIPVAGH